MERKNSSRGYTFTISVILIAAAIIAAASFAREWNRMRDAGASSALRETDYLRTPAMVASGLGSALGASARLGKNSSHTEITVQFQLPLKKEGASAADLLKYGSQLPQLARNRVPLEVALLASQPAGNATVLLLPDSGAVSYDNNASGWVDEVQYVHPSGWTPYAITLGVYCSKNSTRTVSALAQASGVGNREREYSVTYADPAGSSTSTLNARLTSDTVYSVSFADGSNLSMASNLSMIGGANQLKLRYTKSPSAFLVLPFDGNISGAGSGAVLDYSRYGNNMTLGGGSAKNAPAWRNGALCHAGGCYHFDGSPKWMNVANLNSTERAVPVDPPDIIVDGGLESCGGGGSCSPDDGETDDFDSWTEVDNAAGGGAAFDQTVTTMRSGSSAVKVIWDGTAITDDRIYQMPWLSNATEYTLRFWTRGDGTASAKYRLYDTNTRQYLQNDGSWGGQVDLDSGVTGTTYTQVSRTFMLGTGTQGNVEIDFVPDTTVLVIGITGYYVDDVSLKNTTGLNGGFEDYVSSGGVHDKIGNWQVVDDNDDATLQASAEALHTGAVGLRLIAGGEASEYAYSTSLVLNNSTQYALEFWTRSSSGEAGATLRYAVYDVVNGKFLNSDGSWLNPGADIIYDTRITDTSFTKVVRNFMTASKNVGPVQVRFYVPSTSGFGAYVDDVSVTEVKDFTVSMWLQTYNRSQSSTPSILYQYQALGWGNAGMNISLGADANATVYLCSNGDCLYTNATVPDGDWHLLTFVGNRSGNYTLYFDGRFNKTGNFTVGAINTTGSFLLGSDGGGSSKSFNGSIDEVRVYQRALGWQEVENLYRGKPQDECRFNLTVSYSDAALLARELEIDYNARLRVRKLPQDAILAMPFDFNTVSTARGAVIDYSPVAAHGTIGGDTSKLQWSSAGAVGGAYNFATAGSYIMVPGKPYDFGANNYTVSFWVAGDPGGADETLLAKGGYQAAGSWSVYSASSGPSTVWNYWHGSGATTLGTVASGWVHYALVRNGTGSSQLAVYVNGAYSGSGTDATSYSTGMPLAMGDTADADPAYALGGSSIDELRIFNRSLTAAEIRALYYDYAKVYDGPVIASRD